MKITKKELDDSINKKLDTFDSITEGQSVGFVMYDGQKFYAREIDDLNLKKVFSVNEIEKLESHLYSESSNFKNSFNTEMNVNSSMNSSFKSQLSKISGLPIFSGLASIRLFKVQDDYMLILDTKGNFYKYSFANKKVDYTINLVEKIKSLFAISELEYFDILDFETHRDGFFVSTSKNGVFFADTANNNLELKFPENSVKLIKNIGNEKIICINSTGTMSIYDFRSGLRIETFNHIKKLNQSVKEVTANRDFIFALGKNVDNNPANILHIWKTDGLGTIKNIDNSIYPSFDSPRYYAMHISVNGNFVYISGLKDRKHLFVWKYDLEKLEEPFKEIIFKKVEIERLDYIGVEKERISFISKDRLMVIDEEGNIEKNLKLVENITASLVLFNNSALVPSKEKIYLYKMSEYSEGGTETLKIYSSEFPCNNINVLIKADREDVKAVFIDEDTAQQIIPSFYLSHNGNTVAKILGSTAKNILMKLEAPKTLKVEGVVVNTDKIFIK
jgi:hypothetical protein